ncbi:hypothetical protein CERSUDRAFT_85436 [Gelatoporia subvermispora B]|uniref:Uncharacterized protein n=1 Tax=Ceriporiopsis subvermispora (strain B) TaxID=914234 RepID=M2QEJ8_CERS8|nr:hypothetical protein CERSUDRAFT_85436 [Gelatoporia subvermispora B]
MTSSNSPTRSPTKFNPAAEPHKRPTSTVISQPFSSFDHRKNVVEPFEEECKRDVEFMEKLNGMMLQLMLEFHAWSTARPSCESDRTADTLEAEVKAIIELEKDQERSRQRLSDFVNRIKLALAALTELSI